MITVTSFAKTEVTVAGIAAAAGLTYTGSPQSGYTGTATVTGHTDLDAALVCTYASTDGAGYSSTTAPTAAGAYRLTVSVPESNETYTGSASVDFTIAPKELTVTGLSAVNRAYNGSAAVALTGGTLTGVIGSDNVSTTMPTTGTVAAAGIGEAKAVTVVKPSLTGTAAANYTLANLPAVTVDISPAVITVTGAGSVAVTKPYDGTAAAGTLSGTLAFSGKVGTEDVSVSATPGAYDANAVDAGTGKTVELTLSLTGSDQANYTLASGSYSFAGAAITKGTYSGSAIGATLSVPVGDTSTGTISASTFALPGSLKNAAVVSITEASDAKSILTLTGSSYSILPTADTQSASCTVVISSDNYSDVTATLTFVPVNKVLTGIAVKTAPTKTSYVVGNKFDPTGLVLTLTYEDNSTREVAYSDVTKAGFTFSPAADTALARSVTAVSISYGGKAASQTITVSDKHKISIQWKELYNLVYDGTPKHPTFTATGILSGADVTVALDAASQAYTAAGSYTADVTLSGADAADYTIVNPSVAFTIQKAPVTVTVSGDAVAKGAAISTSVTTSPVVGVTLSYRDSSGNTVTPTSGSVGTYDIYAAIPDGNYRFSDATDGAAKKVGVLTVYDTEPAAYAVTFSGGEGAVGTVASLTAAQAGTIRTLPANGFGKVNALFAGWSYAGKVYQPGDTFFQPAAAVTVTAVWQDLYGIGGTVLQDDSPVHGAVVTLMLGSAQIAQSVTDAFGYYSFSVTPGLYNLVAAKDGITQTSAVKITSSSVNGLTLTMPSGKTNTIVEVVAGTPDIVVGGLDNTVKNPTAASKVYTTADKSIVDAGGSVDVKLTADVNNDAANQTTINQSPLKAADVTIGLFLDFGITKTVKSSDGTKNSSAAIKETDDLIELTIDIPASLQGAKNYVVYRLHNGAVQELRTTPNAAGEYIVINSNNTITVYAKYFSVYGLGYTAVLDISFDGNGGTPSVGTMTTDTFGKLASLPTATRSGYTFGGWFTEANGGTQITANTVFTENAKVYAHWSVSGSTGTSTYSITAAAAGGGSVKPSATSAASGTKITVTVTPDSGYTLESLTVKAAGGSTVSYADNKNGTYTFTMPDSAVTVSASFKKAAVFPFTDVPETHWARAGIAWAFENGVFTGIDATSFGPELSTTRGMIATVLWRIEGRPVPASGESFADVPAGRYYAQAVAWAAENGIVTGYSVSSYGPEDDITREQLAAILYRYAKYKGYDVSKGESTSLLAYADAGSISAYALSAMRWAVGTGLLEGSENELLPGAHATRAQVAVLLQRFAQSIAK